METLTLVIFVGGLGYLVYRAMIHKEMPSLDQRGRPRRTHGRRWE